MPAVLTETPNPQLAAPARRDSQIALWLPVFVAFALRFGWVLLFHTYRFTHADHFDFAQEIGSIARSLAQGRGFTSPFTQTSGPTTWVAPFFPCLMAAVFRVFGIYSAASAVVMFALNCAFSSLTCLPIFAIARETTTRRAAWVATWLWAVLPPFMVWATTSLWDAPLTTLILACIVWLTIRLGQHASRRAWLGFGLLWGFAALLNPSLLSALPITVAYIAWKAHQRREPWVASAVLCCAIATLTVMPWLIRNYRSFGHFVFIRGNFWAEMRYGNSVYGDGTWLGAQHPESNYIERVTYLNVGEQRYIAWKKQQTLDFIHEYPRYFAQLCFRRVLLFWWDFGDVAEYTPDVLLTVVRRVFSTLALVGLYFLWRQRRTAAGLIAAILILFPLPYYLTYPFGRYRHVIEPLLLICAVWALAQVREFKRVFAESDVR